MVAAAVLYRELQGNCALGNRCRAVIIGNPRPSLALGRLSMTGACLCARVVGRRGHAGPRDTC